MVVQKYRPIKNVCNVQLIWTNLTDNNFYWEYFAQWTNRAASLNSKPRSCASKL